MLCTFCVQGAMSKSLPTFGIASNGPTQPSQLFGWRCTPNRNNRMGSLAPSTAPIEESQKLASAIKRR